MANSDLLDAALAYTDQGLRVFPVAQNKQPLTPNGFHDATTDRDQVTAWFSADVAGIGAPVPEGVLIVDVDIRNGGGKSMRELKRAHRFPPTRTATTGGGGSHYWYRYDPELRLRNKLAVGVDVKAGGKGYIILPPSGIGDGYSWGGEGLDEAVADAPEWMLEQLVKQEHAAAASTTEAPGLFPWEDGTRYGERALQGVVGQMLMAQDGERNNVLNETAYRVGQLVGAGELREEYALSKLDEAAERVGLDPAEREQTMRSGYEAGLSQPRGAPEAPTPTKSARDIFLELYEDLEDEEEPFWMDWRVEEPPASFILDPIIPRGAYILVYGPTQASKSMVWMALGAEASRRGQRVTYYSLENPPQVDRDRLRRLRPDPDRFRITNQLLDLGDREQVAAFVERERGQDLVVIDTYSHAFGGDFGGDHNAKAIEFAKVVRLAMKKTGATYVVLDHTGFENRGEPRDSSAKRQQVDVACMMQPVGTWTKGKPARFEMRNYKSARYANPFDFTGQIADRADRELVLEWDPIARAQIDWKVPP